MILVPDDQATNKTAAGTGKVNRSPEVDVVRPSNVATRCPLRSPGIGSTTGVF